MTPQEESMLNDLIGRVEQTQLTEKDPEAEQLLLQRLGRNPNALYILAQTVLVQKYALEQATAQINQLRQQSQSLPQPAHTTSFLGSLLGHRDPAPPPPPPPQAPPPPPGYGAPPAQPYAQSWAPVPSYGAPPPPPPGGGSSFLRTAATTAAGVAAGALAFQGVESLLHGFGGQPAGFGGGGGLFGGGGLLAVVGPKKSSPTTTTMTPDAGWAKDPMSTPTTPAMGTAATMPPTCSRQVTT